MDNTRINEQMNFIMELDKVKHVVRQSYLIDPLDPFLKKCGRRENSAEHSWHVSVVALVLQEYAPISVEINKVILMLLLHDVVEIIAGDTFCYDADNVENEKKAADLIFGILPEDQRLFFLNIWNEFTDKSTVNSQFAHCMNMLVPLLYNYKTEGKLWKERNITASMVFYRNEFISKVSPKLWEYAKSIISDSISKGYLDEKQICPK